MDEGCPAAFRIRRPNHQTMRKKTLLDFQTSDPKSKPPCWILKPPSQSPNTPVGFPNLEPNVRPRPATTPTVGTQCTTPACYYPNCRTQCSTPACYYPNCRDPMYHGAFLVWHGTGDVEPNLPPTPRRYLHKPTARTSFSAPTTLYSYRVSLLSFRKLLHHSSSRNRLCSQNSCSDLSDPLFLPLDLLDFHPPPRSSVPLAVPARPAT